ncbi:apolipoprotein L3-like [Microtus pennsylvanicus]|uniref:apolipoprotein L3-like n=1 Tax=Microtus pennsylvanicus TaxID=10058 RepID=UPI003F6BBC69
MAVTAKDTGTLRGTLGRLLLSGKYGRVHSRQAPPSIVDNITTFITNEVGRDDLKLMINEDGVWKAFVEAAELSSEEEAALRDALKQHLAREPADENDETEKRQRKKNFLEQFPELKRKLEEHISKLRALADHLDEVHRGCTISNVVSGSTGIAATIAGFLLAPFTGGASLAIAAAGLGAAATGLTTTIVEESIKGADESEARRLVEASTDIVNRILNITPLITFKVGINGVELFCAWKTFRDYIKAIKTGRIRNFTTIGEGIRQLRNLISHKIPLGTRLARFAKGFGKVSLFALDVYNLVTDSIDLHSGAKTESARALREVANNLEERLREFEQLHKDLQSC